MKREKGKITCPKCGSGKVKWHCKRVEKIQYRCKECNRSFTLDPTNRRLDYNDQFNRFKKAYIKAKAKNKKTRVSDLLKRFDNQFNPKTIYNKIPVLNTLVYLFQWLDETFTPPMETKRFEDDYLYIKLAENNQNLKLLKVWVRVDTKRQKGISIRIRGNTPLASLVVNKGNDLISLENDNHDVVIRTTVPASMEQLGEVLIPLRKIKSRFPIAGY